MQHHSSQRQEAVSSAAVVLSVVKEQQHTPAAEPFRLHVVVSKAQQTTSVSRYFPARRYTIDDNGGSYEGL